MREYVRSSMVSPVNQRTSTSTSTTSGGGGGGSIGNQPPGSSSDESTLPQHVQSRSGSSSPEVGVQSADRSRSWSRSGGRHRRSSATVLLSRAASEVLIHRSRSRKSKLLHRSESSRSTSDLTEQSSEQSPATVSKMGARRWVGRSKWQG
jgi:hypothetical protein